MFFRRKRGPMLRGQTSGEKFLRAMLLLAVFAVTGYLFWVQTGKNMEEIQNRGMIADKTGTLTKEEKKILREMGLFLEQEFGQDLKVVVDVEPVALPELDSKTIFLGLCPEERQVLVEVPPLVRSRLDAEFVLELQTSFFSPYFDSGDWPRGILEAVKAIIQQLTGINDL